MIDPDGLELRAGLAVRREDRRHQFPSVHVALIRALQVLVDDVKLGTWKVGFIPADASEVAAVGGSTECGGSANTVLAVPPHASRLWVRVVVTRAGRSHSRLAILAWDERTPLPAE